jgi:ATP synthase protein I
MTESRLTESVAAAQKTSARPIDIVPADPQDREANRKSGMAYAAALALFASVASFCGLGWLADRYFGTAPWLLAVGLVLGSAAGFYQFSRLTSKL